MDLSTAHLIDGNYSTYDGVNWTNFSVTPTSSPPASAFLPQAKLGTDNYIYPFNFNGVNYFQLASYSSGTYFQTGGTNLANTSALTEQQAYKIDAKIDDGLPQTGNTVAAFVEGGWGYWAGPYLWFGPYWGNGPVTGALGGNATICFDNGNVGGATQQYSVGTQNGANINCALIFKFQ